MEANQLKKTEKLDTNRTKISCTLIDKESEKQFLFEQRNHVCNLKTLTTQAADIIEIEKSIFFNSYI